MMEKKKRKQNTKLFWAEELLRSNKRPFQALWRKHTGPPVWGRLLMHIDPNPHSPARGRSPLPKLALTHLTTGRQRTRITRYPTRLFLGLSAQQRQLGNEFSRARSMVVNQIPSVLSQLHQGRGLSHVDKTYIPVSPPSWDPAPEHTPR